MIFLINLSAALEWFIIFILDYSYIFADYTLFADHVYTFNIDVADGDINAGIDERIGVTVVEVLRNFFNKIENVIVYVCDNSDERHLARKRKFDLWFWKYNDGNIIKEDGIAMVEGTEILNSLNSRI